MGGVVVGNEKEGELGEKLQKGRRGGGGIRPGMANEWGVGKDRLCGSLS